MSENTFVLRFEGLSAAEANQCAEELRQKLLEAAPDIRVERKKDNAASMDFGSTLVLVLGAPSMVLAAKALHSWVTRSNMSSIRIETGAGALVAENLESKDASAIAKAFTAAK